MNATIQVPSAVNPLVQQATPVLRVDAAIPAAAPSMAAAVPNAATAASQVPLPPPTPSLTDTMLSAVSGSDGAIAWGNYLEAIGILCFAIGGLWLLLWLIRRRRYGGSFARVPSMYIESRLALAPRKWVVITRFKNKRLILGLTEENVTLLTEMEVDDEPSTLHGKSGNNLLDFATVLEITSDDAKNA